ncbi:MAG: hypothetical protein SGJ20_05510 [Planctomycetota bacterium]|nr:hypothetical protein [Planctomycetota bacterium]
MGNSSNETERESTSAKPRRRWLRYSLRSLLVLTAVVAVCIGWLFPWYEGARLQREIQANHDYVGVGYEEEFDPHSGNSGVPDWLSGILDYHYFYDINQLVVEKSSDNNLARLRNLVELKSVGLAIKDQITAKGFSYLAPLPKLRTVYILWEITEPGGTDSAADLPGLGQLRQIEDLHLFVPISDASVKEIAQLSRLRKLNLTSKGEVTEAAFQALGNLSALESLDLYIEDSDERSADAGEHAVDKSHSMARVASPSLLFLEKLRKLRSLSIGGRIENYETVVSSLQKLPHLESLTINMPARPTLELVKRLEKLTTLRSLSLHYWKTSGADLGNPRPEDSKNLPEEPLEVSEADLVRLSNALNLKYFGVSLHDTQNGSHLNQFTNLEHLLIYGFHRTKSAVPLQLNLSDKLQMLEFSCMDSLIDADLAQIAQHVRLKELHFYQCNEITDAGLAKLAKLKTLKHLKVEYCDKVTSAAATALRAAMPNVQIEFEGN